MSITFSAELMRRASLALTSEQYATELQTKINTMAGGAVTDVTASGLVSAGTTLSVGTTSTFGGTMTNTKASGNGLVLNSSNIVVTAGDVDVTTGSVNVGTGNIAITTSGNISTASGNITTTSGNLVATSGDVVITNTAKGVKVGSNYVVKTQQTAITGVTLTCTGGGDPTPNGSTTFTSAAAPSNTELLDAVYELNANITSILTALRTHGLIAT